MLLLIILLILIFGIGGGWYGYRSNDGSWGHAGGIGLGTILLVLLVIYLLGGFRHLGL